MSRRLRIPLIGLVAAVFIVISLLVARFLSVVGTEREMALTLLRAEARGDATAMLADLHDCQGTCAATVRSDARALRGAGAVSILAYMSPTAYALGSATGRTRIAWKLPNRLPDVQCLLVRRGGNVLSGPTVTLLGITGPIPLQNDC